MLTNPEITSHTGRPGQGDLTRSPSRRRAMLVLVGVIILVVLAVAGAAVIRARRAESLRRELNEARREMDAGLFGLAGRRLTRLEQERPGQPEVPLLLGRCLAARGQMDEALKAWARVPTATPWSGPAAVELAQGALATGRLALAEQSLRQALARPDPERPTLRRLLLTLLGQMGRIPEARQLLAALWADGSNDPHADEADRLRLLREHMGLDLETFPLEWNLSQLEENAAGAGADDRRLLDLARAHLATEAGDFERARRELERSLGEFPEDPAAWRARLRWAVAADRPGIARGALDHLTVDRFDEIELLLLRAWFARQRHDAPGEQKALEELLETEPASLPALTRLAEIKLQSGEAAAAEALRRRKAELTTAFDRYSRLYKEDRLAEHLPELATLAARLGRHFEAGGFRELAARRGLTIEGLPQGPPPSADRRAAILAELRDMAWPTASPGGRPDARALAMPRFEDRAADVGLAEFVQDNGVSPIHQLPEMSSGGVALLDFDGDGWLDVFCVQGGRFPPDPGVPPPGDRLFRNRGDGTFADVTSSSGIDAMPRGYGHGVAVGDYDNDGHPDLFVTRWRSYALYRNRGDGRFEDRTAGAGLGGDRDWPTSAAFADLDGDGDLDLYVCHYGVWDTTNPRICKDPSGTIILACDPRSIESRPDHMFRNDGGRFVDVSREAGIVDRDGRGLGVVAADLDDDGRTDLFVANDTTANFLFLNRGGFHFEESAHAAGVAASAQGGYQAGMGVACGDLDGDGRLDLMVTNYYGESTSFFHNLGGGLFADHTSSSGLAAPSRHRLGFGVACLDANNDGWMDLMTANGYVSDSRPLYPYAMTAQLFLGTGAGTMSDATSRAGLPFQQPHVGRGLAIGDLDDDGRLDALMVSQNEPLVYFHNETDGDTGRDHFLSVRLEGSRSNRDAVGARVTVHAGGRARVAVRLGGGSFQSACDPRLHFGLGQADRVESIEVRWPSGRVDRHSHLAADCRYLIREADTTPRLLPPSPPIRRIN